MARKKRLNADAIIGNQIKTSATAVMIRVFIDLALQTADHDDYTHQCISKVQSRQKPAMRQE